MFCAHCICLCNNSIFRYINPVTKASFTPSPPLSLLVSWSEWSSLVLWQIWLEEMLLVSWLHFVCSAVWLWWLLVSTYQRLASLFCCLNSAYTFAPHLTVDSPKYNTLFLVWRWEISTARQYIPVPSSCLWSRSRRWIPARSLRSRRSSLRIDWRS